MKKGIRNVDAVARKLKIDLTKVINYRLELAKEKVQKREEMVERQRIKTMAIKRQKARREISLFSEDEKKYESDTKDKTDSDKMNNEYLLPN